MTDPVPDYLKQRTLKVLRFLMLHKSHGKVYYLRE